MRNIYVVSSGSYSDQMVGIKPLTLKGQTNEKNTIKEEKRQATKQANCQT